MRTNHLFCYFFRLGWTNNRQRRMSKSIDREKTESTCPPCVRLLGSRCRIYPCPYHQQALEPLLQAHPDLWNKMSRPQSYHSRNWTYRMLLRRHTLLAATSQECFSVLEFHTNRGESLRMKYVKKGKQTSFSSFIDWYSCIDKQRLWPAVANYMTVSTVQTQHQLTYTSQRACFSQRR